MSRLSGAAVSTRDYAIVQKLSRIIPRETQMSSGIFKVIATFQNADGQPLTGGEYSISLCDKDRFFDDKLGASNLSPDGVAEFLIFVSDIISIDSPDERTPDLYFVVSKKGREIFRSDVFPEVNFEAKDAVTGRAKGLTKSFGPFRVPEPYESVFS